MDFALLPVWIIVFLISGSFHELGHAYVARQLGDDTAERQGRITVNPAAHVDPIGLLVLIVTSAMGFGFGWMKPVPVGVWNLRNPKRDLMLISAAGPMMNILQGILAVATLFALARYAPELAARVLPFFWIAIMLNFLLAAFNLLPVPPLDGFAVANGLLPTGPAESFSNFMRQYGPLLFLAILFIPQVNAVTLGPVMRFAEGLFYMASGVTGL